MLCPVCGHDNFEGEDNCANCGADLAPPTSRSPRSSSRHDPGRAPRRPGRRASRPSSTRGRGRGRDRAGCTTPAPTACSSCDGDRLVGIFTDRDAVVKVGRQRLDGLGGRRLHDAATRWCSGPTTRSRSRSTRWPSAASATSRSSTDGPPDRVVSARGRLPAPRRRARVTDAPDAGRSRIAVVADDLIWATRLADGVRRPAREPSPVRSAAGLAAALPTVRRARSST